ncbi:MAG: type IV pilus modification protein PilV [Azoarcus sp.]|jgi:type IV pilus assembly protein PilV|nr:type IV pilus modification protein PilV [Azoarcus sp.]
MGNAFIQQRGVSLLEVLIAVVVLAFGILGIASTQTGALRNNQGALEQSQVVMLTHSMFEAMRASMEPSTSTAEGEGQDLSRMEVRAGYAAAFNGNKICKTADVKASDELVKNDIVNWLDDVHKTLGDDACGEITCDGDDASLCTVAIIWNNSRALNGSSEQIVETRSRL